MADKVESKTDPSDREREYMRGGKDRIDRVGGSGIYRASSPDAPADAQYRSESELVRHGAPRSTPTRKKK